MSTAVERKFNRERREGWVGGYAPTLPIDEAESCPFCGQQPGIEPWHGGKPTKRLIGCQNDPGCGALPSVVGETRREALAKWNRRAHG